MSKSDFDPYRKWLGIPKGKRPPTHYDLLGVGIDEDDHDVIRSAADQRRSFVEKQRGKGHEEAVTGILYQLDEAEMTLINPELRRDYDQRLKLFGKRRRKRQVDPKGLPSRVGSQSGRTVGEESGLAGQFGKIVAIVAIAFFGIAAASFYLPWSKLDESPERSLPTKNTMASASTDASNQIEQQTTESAAEQATSENTETASAQRKLEPVPSVAGQVPDSSNADAVGWTAIRGHEAYVTGIAVSRDGNKFATCSQDRTVRLWDFGTGEQLWRYDDRTQPKEKNPLAITFDENDAQVVVITRSRVLKLDSTNGKQTASLGPFEPRLDWATFSAGGTLFAAYSGSDTPTLSLYRTNEATLSPFQKMKELVPMGAINERGELYAGHFENSQRTAIVDGNSGRIQANLNPFGGRVFAATFSSSGNYLAIAKGDRKPMDGKPVQPPVVSILKRNGNSWDEVQNIQEFTFWNWSLCFSPSERYLAIGGYGREDDWFGHNKQQRNKVRVVDVKSGEVVQEHSAHNAAVLDLEFTPDGTHLISAGADSNVRRWRIKTSDDSLEPVPDYRKLVLESLAGSVWTNTFGGRLEWTDDGRLLQGEDRQERRWFPVGRHEVKIMFSTDHIDSINFDKLFTSFKQFVRDGTKNVARGTRISSDE